MRVDLATAAEKPTPGAKAFCVAGAVVILLAWILLGPGHKHDEGVLVFGAGLLIGGLGLVCSLLSPSVRWNGSLFPGIWLVGYLTTWVRVALMYDYPVLDLTRLWPGVAVASIASAVLLALNAAVLWLRSR